MTFPNLNEPPKKRKGLVIGISSVLAIALAGGIFYYADDLGLTEQKTTQPKQEEVIENPNATTNPTEPTIEQPAETPLQNIDATKYAEDQAIPTEPTYINGILIANKQFPLPSTYAPDVQPEARQALDAMVAAAAQEGFQLTGFSGYRSYEYQTTLYNNYVARDGKEAADRYSARPGYSEHQTGLAFDIGEIGREDLWLTEAFGETAAGQWLVEHADEYGFILRYPKGKENLTGFMYESWHFRYVGTEHATKIKQQNVTLEEYLGVYDNPATNQQPADTDVDEVAPNVQTPAPEEPTATDEQPQVGAKSHSNNQ